MRCSPLRYYRTQVPKDIESFEPIHKWTCENDSRVTYPSVLRLRDGSVYMLYRDGAGGNGVRILIHYDEESQRWTKTVLALTDGRDRNPTYNAYPFGVVAEDAAGEIPTAGVPEDRNGVWHIAWCWRETPDVVTNFDVCYARSLDRGASWQSWDGRRLELPITPENAYVVEPIEQKCGLINAGTSAVVGGGRPYIAYTRYDKNGHDQIYVATPVDSGWKIVQLTDWKHRFYFYGRGTIPQCPPVPRLSITKEQRIVVTYSYAYAKPKQGQLLLTTEELLSMKPGQYPIRKPEGIYSPVPNIRAVNHGRLLSGSTDYMQQETDPPNRDRKPEKPREPTMTYVVEVKTEG